MNARDVMSEPAVTCTAQDTLQQAAEKMRDHNVGVLVVVTEEGQSQSVVTDRDICLTAADLAAPLAEIQVDAARSTAALICHPDDSLQTAQSIMQASGVRRLVVADRSGRPMGILSIDDLATEALREIERKDDEPDLPPEQLIRTLGEIARSPAHGHLPVPPGSEAMPRTPA